MLNHDVLRNIRRIHLRAKKMVLSQVGGEYHSAFKGAGLSFDEVREYAPGDDIRFIDWNVTARAGKPFIKRYVEERELVVYLVVDLSASQDYGTTSRTKREVAAELAALVAFAALQNNDKVGFLGFSDRVERFVPASKGTRHALRLLRDILSVRSEGRKTDLSMAFDHLCKVQKRRATVFVLSDFHDRSAPFPAGEGQHRQLRRIGRQHDTIAIRTLDRHECELPNVGLVNVRDPETGQQTLIDTSDRRFRNDFATMVNERDASLKKTLASADIDYVDVRTDGQHIEELVKYLHRRGNR